MPVYEIAVRFMRRAQVKEYEPAEAEVSFKANIGDGEDHLAIANGLMADAKAVAIESGLKAGKATATTESAPAAEAPKNKGGRPPKQTLTPPAETKPAETKAAATDDFGDPAPAKTETKAAPAPAPAPAAADDEFAAFDKKDEPIPSVKELQDWITAQMQAKKIEVVKVREILAKYGAARTADTKEGDRLAIKADVIAALKS